MESEKTLKSAKGEAATTTQRQFTAKRHSETYVGSAEGLESPKTSSSHLPSTSFTSIFQLPLCFSHHATSPLHQSASVASAHASSFPSRIRHAHPHSISRSFTLAQNRTTSSRLTLALESSIVYNLRSAVFPIFTNSLNLELCFHSAASLFDGEASRRSGSCSRNLNRPLLGRSSIKWYSEQGRTRFEGKYLGSSLF
ncbi:hypothetical protein LR48_Vigan226s000200 [Vigna angularis]|uniref:Uncharacterized protein n=1 Tax=Phaseolus angularis TaxID=3914 RepID=A0A0L9T668_PHAAN|nr:hypothetical protein LR48_Vigan226s000200 [Vigna angularis]